MKKYIQILSITLLSVGILAACGTKEETKKETTETTAQTTENDLYKKYDKEITTMKNAITPYEDVNVAIKAGYIPVSTFVPLMGYHFQNANITEFSLDKPSILLYVYANGEYKLVGAEWGTVDPNSPSPIPGLHWTLSHGASAHYADNTELPAASPKDAFKENPKTGAKYVTWHPDIFGIHVYTHVKNPDGPFADSNLALVSYNSPELPPGFENYFGKPKTDPHANHQTK